VYFENVENCLNNFIVFGNYCEGNHTLKIPQRELYSRDDGWNVSGEASWQYDYQLGKKMKTSLTSFHAAVFHQTVDSFHNRWDLKLIVHRKG
jgi:hypothetical protein